MAKKVLFIPEEVVEGIILRECGVYICLFLYFMFMHVFINLLYTFQNLGTLYTQYIDALGLFTVEFSPFSLSICPDEW